MFTAAIQVLRGYYSVFSIQLLQLTNNSLCVILAVVVYDHNFILNLPAVLCQSVVRSGSCCFQQMHAILCSIPPGCEGSNKQPDDYSYIVSFVVCREKN